jgi:hypothetical protein
MAHNPKGSLMRLHRPASRRLYAAALTLAWEERAEIRQSCTDYREHIEIDPSAHAFLSADRRSGFLIIGNEICGLFSTARGRGDSLVRDAIAYGGRRLDCFDGFLPTLYRRHGFAVTRRVPNYTPGGPDVVYMRHYQN